MVTDLTRRSFLKVVGGAGAAFVLGCYSAPASGLFKNTEKEAAQGFQPNAFIQIDPDGTVTVTVNKSDMGQGIRTTFAMIVAEEMDADWSKVKVAHAPPGGPAGGQGTGGSSSTRQMYGTLRQLGAGARAMLVAAAAKSWGVDAGSCKCDTGKVMHPATGKSMTYGELTSKMAGVTAPDGDLKLKDKADFKILGKRTRRVDNKSVVTGTATFGIDVKLDGMLYAVVSRRPSFGASMGAVDDTATRKVPGVVDVVKISSGVAVVAKDTWAAMEGVRVLKVTWDAGPNASVSTASIRAGLVEAAGTQPDLPAGAKAVKASIDFPYLAHATMEPMNAVADVRDDSCVIYSGTQSPDGAQRQAAQMLGIPAEKVTVHLTLLGGGFGRRSANDFIADAVQVSKAVKKPIKLVWTREDDMRNDHYRPMSHHSFQGGVDASGTPVAWNHVIINAGGRAGRGGPGRAGIPYAISGATQAGGAGPSPVPTGAWRSVEHSQIDVANECFIDEMAHAAGKDPLEFRVSLARDERLKKVLTMAAEKAGWGTPLPKGHGRGIACFSGYGACIAHVMEVSVVGNDIKVHRMVAVVDPGFALNPQGVEAQIQGAGVDGMSTALKVGITIEKGGVVEGSWPDYPWMTMGEMPKQEVFVIDSGNEPSGMGEVGYPSGPPAIANAVFAATGKRVRKFPIKVTELV